MSSSMKQIEMTDSDISSKLGIIFRGTTIPNSLKNWYFLNRESHKVTNSKYYEEMCPLLFANYSQAIDTIYNTISEKYPRVQYYNNLFGHRLDNTDKREVFLELLRNCPQAQCFFMFHTAENFDNLQKNVIKEANVAKWRHLHTESVTINRDIFRKLAFWWSMDADAMEETIFQDGAESIVVSMFLFWAKTKDGELSPAQFVPYVLSLYNTAEELCDYFDGSLYRHVFFPNYEPFKFEYATYFLNDNTRTFLVHQNLEKFREMPLMSSSRVMFLTWKQWFLGKIPVIHQRSFMLFSSVSLYMLGLRPCRDIDVMVSEHLPRIYDEGIQHYMANPQTKFPFVDISKPGLTDWNADSYKNQWFNSEWPRSFGANTLDDVIFNPRYHGYIMGMKVVCLEGDMKRRSLRNRPSATADLFYVKNNTDILINSMDIPKQCLENGTIVSYESIPQKVYFLKKVCTYLKHNYHISIPLEDLYDFLNISDATSSLIREHLNTSARDSPVSTASIPSPISPIPRPSIVLPPHLEYDDNGEYI